MAMIVMASLATGALPILGMQVQLCLEFVFGLLVCEVVKHNIALDRRIGAICILMSLTLFAVNYRTLDIRALQWGIPAVLLVLGVLSFETSRILRHPLVVLGGNASYAIYLTHITVHTVAFKIEGTYGSGGIGHNILAFSIELSVVLMVGVAFHLFIERPLIMVLRTARDRATRRYSIAR
jgi:exopolysaccharide production protein ExoZ